MTESSKKINDAIFGPLQLKGGDFDYDISKVCEINNELLEYIRIIDEENNQKTKITDLIKSSIFIRIIRLNLGHIKPIIGLITVKKFNQSYNINHISIHKSFRRQGLAKLLLLLFANYLNEENINSTVTCIIPSKLDDIIYLFRSLKFNEITIGTNNHMLKPTKLFIKITESPINIITV